MIGCGSQPPGEPSVTDDSKADSALVGEQSKLTSDTAIAGNQFGSILALSGNTAVLGSKSDNSAIVFERTGDDWTETGRLRSENIAAEDVFGYVVAIDGNTAVVGNWKVDEQRGSAHIFIREADRWTEQGVVEASDGEAGFFGSALAISGDTIVVGNDRTNSNSGSAYVFERHDGVWSETLKLRAPDEAGEGERFGASAAVERDRIVIGASADRFFGVFSGSTYVFRRGEDGWALEVQLFAGDRDHHDQFGYSVAISGETILVGAYGDDDYLGSAYVFTHQPGTGEHEGTMVWSQEAKLTASDGSPKDRFGLGVAIDGDMVLIGSDQTDVVFDDQDDDSGAVYAYLRADGKWREDRRIVAEDADSDFDYRAHFGYPVALSGVTALVGASPEKFRSPLVGFAYAFEVARDFDDDGVADYVDNCPGTANSEQENFGGDDLGDHCDDDDDNDGHPDKADNCSMTPNPDQKNADSDTLGDACDDDDDGDSIDDSEDNCPLTANAPQHDGDVNGVGDACEDLDGDGVSLLDDNCPDHPNSAQDDEDGNGVGDACDDLDEDGVSGIRDNCPEDDNPDQADLDGDGLGDACDSDFDGDGVLNEDDNCPRTPNADQSDVCQTPYGCSAGTGTAPGSAPFLLIGLLMFVRRRARCG